MSSAESIVTKRVALAELNPVSELPPTTRFTENAESVPLGVFLCLGFPWCPIPQDTPPRPNEVWAGSSASKLEWGPSAAPK